MKLNPIRPKRWPVSPIRRTVIPVKIMLIASMIVTSYIISVMAMQTGFIRVRPDKLMICQFAVRVTQVTGRATGAMECCRIWITPVIDMTAQAAAAKQVIDQGNWRINRLSNRNINHTVQFPATKGHSNNIYLFFQGKVKGCPTIFYLLSMAFAAGQIHIIRVGGIDRQVFVGFFPAGRRSPPPVAAGTVNGVIFIKFEFMTVPAA